MKKWERKNKKINKTVLVVTTTLVCIFLCTSFAWYYYNANRSVNSEEREVMVPYYLYLLDENSSDYFQLQVLNMHPGEKTQVIVCVSNEDRDGSKIDYSVGRNSSFHYEIELAYTQNIPLDYTIYELEKTDSSEAGSLDVFKTEYEYMRTVTGEVPEETVEKGTKVINYWRKKKEQASQMVLPLKKDEEESKNKTESNNIEMYGENYKNEKIVNVAKYDIYHTNANGEKLELKTEKHDLITKYEHHYYMIEIEWDETVTDFSKYIKEVDLVYMMVKAIQPEPKEQSGD